VARTAARQDGYMLPELLIAMVLLLSVSAAVLAMMEGGSRQQPRVTEKNLRLDVARDAVNRMQRELRQGFAVLSNSSQSVDFLTYVRNGAGTGVQRRVAYVCASGTCTRYETVPDASVALPAGGKEIVTGVQNSDVFSYEPTGIDPSEVRIKLVLSVRGSSGTVTLTDGAELRNRSE
jgi:type II secretory pathway pseudopilin PulG